MALLTRPDLLGAPLSEERQRMKAASARATLLKEAKAPDDATFDIFLSHSSRHPREVRAIKRLIEGLGYSVYVDWVEDEELDRTKVAPATAARLRHRIAASRSLLVHATEGARLSRWVPWETGFADGLGRPVGVLPVIAEKRRTNVYVGVEFFGLYPYVDFAPAAGTAEPMRPWVRRTPTTYVNFDAWLKGRTPVRRSA